MMRHQIILPTAFTERHQRAVEQYIQDAWLAPTEWQYVLEAFDLLSQAQAQKAE